VQNCRGNGITLGPTEQLEDLQRCNLKIIQSSDTFRFGIDSVLLADFAPVRKGDKVLDLGTGNGVIPLLLAGKREPGLIHGLEIQPRLVDMARRSVALNGLTDLITIIEGDFCSPPEALVPGSYDLVVSNPPYLAAGGRLNLRLEVAIARHELKCTLADVLRTGARMLRHRGRLALIYRSGRLVDLLTAMRAEDLEPKTLRFVQPASDQGPTMVLVLGVKGARPHLNILPPLVIYDREGNYSREIMDIYNEKGSGEEG